MESEICFKGIGNQIKQLKTKGKDLESNFMTQSSPNKECQQKQSSYSIYQKEFKIS